MSTISIAADFSTTPGGRFRTDGPFSGQQFREDILIPALEQSEVVTVELDGTRGYPSSFLDEAFAGLVRERQWSLRKFKERIHLQASEGYRIYVDDILLYVQEAADEIERHAKRS